MEKKNNVNKKTRRRIRIRSKVQGISERPRLSVYRSNKYIYAQIINDEKGETLIGISEKELPGKEKINKTEKAKNLGKIIAKKAIAKKIKKVVFDRGSYAYHGRVKALAEGAREGGLEF
ncbi:MAG: 50S ribosomal protein L18 [Candidatus Levybacteria bacterium CG_4_10_14_0_8_um_filter_35_23]|nr:MAG: 50S ribosomal protein L18 [Candidatus Levybacteria bacterium CG_4_10_14_0_8_um_filter_35_23]